MPFTRPTLAQLIERIAADIESRLPGTDPRTRRSVLAVLARAHAGAVHALYGYLAWAAQQVMPDTAETDILDRLASIWGVARKAAAPAAGNVTFSGNNGITIPAGTELQRSDSWRYTTDADAIIASGTATAAVTAVTAGADGNSAANTMLVLVSPIAGINSTATVAAGGLTAGTDTESDDDLRDRLIDRIQSPPHGGAKADYERWAKEIAGVTRAWVYPLENGADTVVVRFVRDDDGAGAAIIPDAGEVAAVQSHINDVRPVTAVVTVAAPTAVALAFTIALTPNTQAVRDAVTAELTDLLRREAEPGGTILLSHIREAISIAAGETNHVLTVPSADVTHMTGQIAVMGTITWA